MIQNIAEYSGALAVLIAATVIDLAAVAVAFRDFLKKDKADEEKK